jgi:hypothetical protein
MKSILCVSLLSLLMPSAYAAELPGDGERCQDEADAKSTDHGKIFHFCTPFH